MNTKPLTTTELIILRRLSQQPSSGYDLRRYFLTLPKPLSTSSIYTALHRLHVLNYVQSRSITSSIGPPKLVYRCTLSGVKALGNTINHQHTALEKRLKSLTQQYKTTLRQLRHLRLSSFGLNR